MTIEQLKMIKLSNTYEVGVDESQGIFFGDQDTRDLGTADYDIEQFKWILGNHDKTLSLGHNKIQIGKYWKIMKGFVKSEFQSDVEDNSLMLNQTCWECQHEPKVTSELKKCGVCKVAKYCSKLCQRKDWKTCHKMMCLRPNLF